MMNIDTIVQNFLEQDTVLGRRMQQAMQYLLRSIKNSCLTCNGLMRYNCRPTNWTNR